MKNIILAASVAIFINACGGGGAKSNDKEESTSSSTDIIQSTTTTYTDSPTPVVWSGSVNGELVSDANGDFVWFDTSGNMYSGGVLITNFWLNGFKLYLNSDYIGDVTEVQALSGGKMTMVVAPYPDNYALDFYVQDGIFYVTGSAFVPVFLERTDFQNFN